MIVNTVIVYIKIYHKFVLGTFIKVDFKEIICEVAD